MVINFKDYFKILRVGHWPKQIFLIPGFIYAFYILRNQSELANFTQLFLDMIICILIVSITSSANYCINEYLDAEYDKHHPLKKYRPSAQKKINPLSLIILYVCISVFVLILSFNVNQSFFISTIFFIISGVIYNVEPFRTKDIKIIDVLTESINNPIRLYLGYSFFIDSFDIPFSLLIGYWMGGAFLMACKRLSEKLYLKDQKVIKSYRPSIFSYKLIDLKLHIKIYALISIISIFLFLNKFNIFYSFLSLSFIFLFIDYYKISSQLLWDIQTPEKLFTNIKYIIKIVTFFTILLLISFLYENFLG